MLSGEYPWLGASKVEIIYKVALKGERLPLPPAEEADAAAWPHPDPDMLLSAASLRRCSGGGGAADAGRPLVGGPACLPPAIRDLIAACFAAQPADRPDTLQAVSVIDSVLMQVRRRGSRAGGRVG
jgi:hypothetical protein